MDICMFLQLILVAATVIQTFQMTPVFRIVVKIWEASLEWYPPNSISANVFQSNPFLKPVMYLNY